MSKAVLAAFAFSMSSFRPAVSPRYFGSSENQSQKLPRSLSGVDSAEAAVSAQSPLAPGRWNRQFRQERRSLLHTMQESERPKGSCSTTGEPQYQHMAYDNLYGTGWQAGKMLNSPMFAIVPCAAGCGRPAISGSNICFIHQADHAKEIGRIVDYIAGNETIKDLNVAGMKFAGVDFSNHRFFGCNFRDASFCGCVFSETFMRMCFFDFAQFTDCSFLKSDFQFLSFAGTQIVESCFRETELVHINFLGAGIARTVFDDSNLYNSRFINADMDDSKFVNCNVMRVNFAGARREKVVFKSTNTADAIFEMEMP